MNDVNEAWRRIDASLTEQDEYATENFPPGATPDAIARLEAELGIALPDDVRAGLAYRDGTDQATLVEGTWSLLSVAEIRHSWGWMKTSHDAGEFAKHDESVRNEAGVKRAWWAPRWIPIATDHGGDYVVVDLDPDTGGHAGQLVRVFRDYEVRRVIAPSFAEWMATLASELDGGKYVWNEGLEPRDE